METLENALLKTVWTDTTYLLNAQIRPMPFSIVLKSKISIGENAPKSMFSSKKTGEKKVNPLVPGRKYFVTFSPK